MTHLTTQPELPTELQQEFTIKPGQILEKIAQRYECTLEDVLLALPTDMFKIFVGRNAQKELHAHQIEALYTLFHTLNKEAQ